MHTSIESVRIEGFWGNRIVDLDFDSSVNFLIGRNGSGKTTAINIVAAVLTADFAAVDRAPFETVTIKLAEVGGRRKPYVILRKKSSRNSQVTEIEYSVRDSAGGKPEVYTIDRYERELFRRDISRVRDSRSPSGRSILRHLDQLVNVSWLSISRHSGMSQREERVASTIDRKVEELANSLVRFFSKLSDMDSKMMANFQKQIVLSMVSEQSVGQWRKQINDLGLDREREALEAIYRQFGLETHEYQRKTAEHFDAFASAREKFFLRDGFTLRDAAVLTGTVRILSVIEVWNRLEETRREVFEQRDTFLEVLNRMVIRKRFFINEKNELTVETDSGSVFPLTQLSSGEKQLLIVLSEALLQEQRPWIYIADEPELSLHVSWQESLVANIVAMNPNAQIIFATHSPDIVSTYSRGVIDMERVLR